ncbi:MULTISPECIES: DUF937 domain-containing protein [Legionella]|uniref:DUF937 domain-containing protein n=1 Tax=Legionella drozanskii LLAP-1 TaxID=1212489 RepID=A0A0W0SXT8_9GAMM|nr:MULTISPECIES: DUF937 domain-containing protein [Legionella]KTC88116.1 hypothetical protein Ldro_1735 [Legionella drozanskii LLAP-1]PJE08031.1 MAG: DUF937 domain-containing protein [Legionella sp.]
MDNSIFSEIMNFIQNHSDGQKMVEQSNVSTSQMHKVAQEVVPKITEQVKNDPQTLGDLFKIIAQNKNDPQSLLNSKPGFDQEQVQNEGSQILQAIFGGSNQTSKIADDVSQKTGISVVDITEMLPMIAAMATKLLGNKVDTMSDQGDSASQQKSLNEILGFLDINKDGSISDDLGRMGQKIMGNLFGNQNKQA